MARLSGCSSNGRARMGTAALGLGCWAGNLWESRERVWAVSYTLTVIVEPAVEPRACGERWPDISFTTEELQKDEARLKVVQTNISKGGGSSAVLCRPFDAEEGAEWTPYPSANAAARALMLSATSVARCARGGQSYCGRYHFVWRDDLVAQCDLCKKWRKLPSSASRKLPKHWSCQRNPDKAAASCEIAEEQWPEAEAETAEIMPHHDDAPAPKRARRASKKTGAS